MTTLRRRKQKQCKKITIALLGGIALLGSLNVFLYNNTLEARRGASAVRDEVKALRVENVDLKNQTYAAVESNTLIAAADRLGLVKERNPEYLHLGGEVTHAGGRTTHVSISGE